MRIKDMPVCPVCRTRMRDVQRHLDSATHGVKARMAELSAEGWDRAMGTSRSIRPLAPHMLRLGPSGHVYGYMCSLCWWTHEWALRVFALVGVPSRIRKHWFSRLSRSAEEQDAFVALCRMSRSPESRDEAQRHLTRLYGLGLVRSRRT